MFGGRISKVPMDWDGVSVSCWANLLIESYEVVPPKKDENHGALTKKHCDLTNKNGIRMEI